MKDEDRARTRAYVARLDAARATKALEIEETVSRARGMTPEEHDITLRQVVATGFHVLQTRPDFEAVMRWKEPPASDFKEIWARLHQSYLASKSSRS